MGEITIEPRYHRRMVKGSYILLITLPQQEIIKAGSRKAAPFPGGYYAYVGSAMGGFKARLGHHLKESSKPHWHIDYLLQRASIDSIILCESEERVECAIARALSAQFKSIPGFGASDCRCRSHLFFATEKEPMKMTIMATLRQPGAPPKLVGLLTEPYFCSITQKL